MHDMNGTELHIGDTVNIPCVIKEQDSCNVRLETIQGRRPDNQPEIISAINTGVLVLSRRPCKTT